MKTRQRIRSAVIANRISYGNVIITEFDQKTSELSIFFAALIHRTEAIAAL